MTIAVAVASILAFLVAFWAVKVVAAATKAITTATGAMKILANKDLDDAAKEKATQKAAISLLRSVVSIATRCAVSIVAAGIPIYAAQVLGIAPVSDTIDFLSRWDVILISSLVISVLYLVGRQLWATK